MQKTSNSSDMTIVYYTENRLKEPLFSACQRHLEKSANGRPIISVSHKPLDLGYNICIGEKKRSWLLLYKQVFKGVEAAKTKYVAMAEHDCFYTDEHFSFIPPRDDTFYYNENHWLVQYAHNSHPELKGMYSRYWTQRLALSQMICNRDLFLKTLNARLDLLDKDRKLVRDIIFAGEPGLSKLRLEKTSSDSEKTKKKRIDKIEEARKWAESGRPVYLKQFLQDQLDTEKYGVFHTETPNLDVRHDGNFTGPKRGKKRCYEIPYWGKFEDLINSNISENR